MTTTDKLETGYQYICNNNLITKFMNYQMTESDIDERRISRLDDFHILPPNTDENIASNGIWKISQKQGRAPVCRNTFMI